MNVRSVYSRLGDRQYHGLVVNDEDLDQLASKVRRIIDDTQTTEALLDNFNTIGLTGFSVDKLNEIAQLQLPDEHYEDWRIGEALAQLLLEENYTCIIPFSKEANTTNHNTNNTGIDLLGLAIGTDDSVLLLFAEVKTSSENRNPPQIVHSSSEHSLTGQLKGIIKNKQKRMEHIRYLAKEFGTSHEYLASFVSAAKSHYEGSYGLYGLAIRDTNPNENDLSKTADALNSDDACSRQACTLLSLHIDSMSDLKERVLAVS